MDTPCGHNRRSCSECENTRENCTHPRPEDVRTVNGLHYDRRVWGMSDIVNQEIRIRADLAEDAERDLREHSYATLREHLWGDSSSAVWYPHSALGGQQIQILDHEIPTAFPVHWHDVSLGENDSASGQITGAVGDSIINDNTALQKALEDLDTNGESKEEEDE